jgi:hypothetical protein
LDTTKSSHDWQSKWSGSTRTLENAGNTDPQDSQTAMSGSASRGIVLGSGESILHPGTPRLYINKRSSAPGFENVEFTAYANWKSDGSETSNAGFTMVARTNHFQYKDNGCNAPGYYVRIWEGSDREGQISFQKEYYHASDTIYSSGIYKGLFSSFPKNQWIGMKFVVFTIPGTSGDVQLEVYIDRTDGQSGGTWTLEHSYVDRRGACRVNVLSKLVTLFWEPATPVSSERMGGKSIGKNLPFDTFLPPRHPPAETLRQRVDPRVGPLVGPRVPRSVQPQRRHVHRSVQ